MRALAVIKKPHAAGVDDGAGGGRGGFVPFVAAGVWKSLSRERCRSGTNAESWRAGPSVLFRADSGGGTHEFLAYCHRRRVQDGHVDIRNSKNTAGPALIFTQDVWDAFTLESR